MVIVNGKSFECAFFGISTLGNMHIVIENSTVTAVAAYFSNPNNLTSIKYKNGEEETEYLGFVKLIAIAPQDDGVRVSLRRRYEGEE